MNVHVPRSCEIYSDHYAPLPKTRKPNSETQTQLFKEHLLQDNYII